MQGFCRLALILVVTAASITTLLACTPAWQDAAIGTPSTDRSSGSLESPNPIVPSLPDELPTPVPTLGADVRWIEPEADQGVIVTVPDEVRGGQTIYLIRPDGTPPVLLANVKGVFLASAAAAPNGKWLVVESENTSRGYEPFSESLSLLSLDTLTWKPIVEKASILTYVWSVGGDMLAYTIRDRANMLQLLIYELAKEIHRPLFSSPLPGKWYPYGWTWDGKGLLVAHLEGGGLLFDQAMLLDVSDGSRKPIYSDPEKLTQAILPAPTGQTVLITTRQALNASEISMSLLDLNSGLLTPLFETVPFWMASAPVWAPDGRRIALAISAIPQKKGIPLPIKIIVMDTITGQYSIILHVDNPPMLVMPLAWASNDVLIVNNLGGEVLDQVVYSMRDDGSNIQKISWGRFMATVPLSP